MPSLIDLRGRRFGGLLVLDRAPSRPSGATYWRCRCEGCGDVVEVESQNLRRGMVRSCGGPGCRGKFSAPDAVEVLGEQHVRGSVGTVAAMLRASIDDDHAAVRDVVLGLDERDDLVGLLLHLLRIGTVALVKAEGSRSRAHAVVDGLAAWDRRDR